MAELPHMPLFIDDYEAATSHLSLEEDGAYNRLLRLCWRQPDCTIPDLDSWIIRMMRCDKETFERAVRPIIGEFFTEKNGRLFQKRQKTEHGYVKTVTSKRKEAGRKGGLAKSLKSKDNTDSKTTDLPEQKDSKALAPTPTPTPTPTPNDKTEPAGSDWGVLESQLRSAAGWQHEAHPTLAVVGPIVALIEAGASLEKDVLPIVKALAPSAETRSSWRYFLKAIERSWRERTGFAQNGANGFHVQQVDAVKWAERIEWARKNQQWGEVWGPMPGKLNCGVPANLLKPEDGQGWNIWRPNP